MRITYQAYHIHERYTQGKKGKEIIIKRAHNTGIRRHREEAEQRGSNNNKKVCVYEGAKVVLELFAWLDNEVRTREIRSTKVKMYKNDDFSSYH